MNTFSSRILVASLVLAAAPAFAFNLGDAAKAVTGASQGVDVSQVATTPQTSGLLNALTGQLGVSPEQAVGGTGALLGMAKNNLSSTDYSQLLSAVPGLDKLSGGNALANIGGLGSVLGGQGAAGGSPLGNLSNLGDVNQAFGALGMDGGMTSQFAQVLLDYFGKQGLNSDVLGNLGNLWGVAAG
ncbi:DUF2780 domain-containing protein [Zestomonas carbonaria]|uniref:DUF2780 domain-containing protein n=1 Tax=Zestomonas carbonaria TaxID=2762745 RepID=A0A7U7I7U8_9GAMM|nr:DUF2780 domain-containing protein [Pseudomonas carbonaria]CAD5106570.1 hypothetical protein PSEWESI4_00835 [Pseudomonas carbonaria]